MLGRVRGDLAITDVVGYIDKDTGVMFREIGAAPSGKVSDSDPALYFGPRGMLYLKDLMKVDPTYVERKPLLVAEYAAATAAAKAASSREKKRARSAAWDESCLRKL